MGTASFEVGRYGADRDGSVISSHIRTSGAHTTSTTASFAEDAAGDIVVSRDELFTVHADEAMRVEFGGDAATASTGHYVPAGAQRTFQVDESGKVSIIDVA